MPATEAIKAAWARQITTAEECIGQTIERVSTEASQLVFAFTTGKYVVCCVDMGFESGDEVPEIMASHLAPEDLHTHGLVSLREFRGWEAAANAQYEHESEQRERKKLAELLAKYGTPSE